MRKCGTNLAHNKMHMTDLKEHLFLNQNVCAGPVCSEGPHLCEVPKHRRLPDLTTLKYLNTVVSPTSPV